MLVTPATQSAVVVEQMQDTTVEAGDDAASGQVVADGVLPPGQPEQAAGADRPVPLDRRAVPCRAGPGRKRRTALQPPCDTAAPSRSSPPALGGVSRII